MIKLDKFGLSLLVGLSLMSTAQASPKLDPVLAAQIAERTDLRKLDPVLSQAYEEALDPNLVSVEIMASVDGAQSEEVVREMFGKYGLNVRSVISGTDTIVTAQGTLAQVIALTSEELVRYLEGSRVLWPEPSVSVGN